MKILILNGSPRMNGNTRTALKAIESGIDTSGNQVEFVDITKYKLSGCTGCNSCHTNVGTCIIKDDCIPLVEKICEADTVIFGSAVYWWGITAQLKMLIDKMYFKNTVLPKQKKNIGIIAVGADELSGEQYDLISRQFKCICEYLDWNLIIDEAISAAEIGDMAKQTGRMEELKEIGRKLK